MKLNFGLFLGAALFAFSANAQHQKQLGSLLNPTEAGFTKSDQKTTQCLGLRKASDITEPFMQTVTSGPVYHASANKLETIRKRKKRRD